MVGQHLVDEWDELVHGGLELLGFKVLQHQTVDTITAFHVVLPLVIARFAKLHPAMQLLLLGGELFAVGAASQRTNGRELLAVLVEPKLNQLEDHTDVVPRTHTVFDWPRLPDAMQSDTAHGSCEIRGLLHLCSASTPSCMSATQSR